MKYLKLISIAFIIIISSLLLCSCEISTTLTADGNFSGTREMVCTISKAELNSEYVYGTIEEIETELRNYLPDALTMERKANIYGGYRFIFNLNFSSYNEYVQKVTALLGREPSITYSQKDGLFCSGIALKEDFSSADLLDWAATALEKSKLCPRIRTGEVTFVSSEVLINGEKLENKDTTNKKINVNKQNTVTINNIEISTEKTDFENFERTVTYHFPDASVEKVGKKEFESYMKSLGYKDCKANIDYSVKNEDSGEDETLVTYSFKVKSDLLGEYTNAVLNGKNGEVQYEFDPDFLTPFSGEWALYENLDLSSWCNLYDYALCPVTLRYKTDDGSRFSKSYAVCGVAAINAEIKNNGRVSSHASLRSDNIKVNITANYNFPLQDVKVSVFENSSNSFTKSVSLLYKNEEDSTFGPKYFTDYYELKGFTAANFKPEVTEEGFGRMTVEFYGSTDKISSKAAELFGDRNYMSQDFDESSKFTLTLKTNVSDHNDLSRFLREAGYEGKLTYTFRPNPENRIEDAVIKNSQDAVIMDVDDELNAKGKISTQLSEYNFSYGYSSIGKNKRLIVIFAIAAIVLVLGLVVIIFMDNNSQNGKRYEKDDEYDENDEE